MANVVGREVSESLLLAADPKRWSKDILLLRAKQFTKLTKAKHLSKSELRAVAWFALLPELSNTYPERQLRFMRENEERNFWDVYKREPAAVLIVLRNALQTAGIKDHESHEEKRKASAPRHKVKAHRFACEGRQD
jgi:hypothetical protein